MVDATKKKAIDSLRRAWPELTDLEKARLLGMCEGLEIKVEWARQRTGAETGADGS